MEETPVEMSALPGGRQKNPAKVAAGKKSAENRKKRQREAETRHEDVASRLAKLEESKQAMHRDLVDEELKEPEQPITIVTKDPPASGWPIETIAAGGLGLAVIAYMAYKAQALNIARSVPSTEVRQPNSSTTEPRQRDPFYME